MPLVALNQGQNFSYHATLPLHTKEHLIRYNNMSEKKVVSKF